MTLVLQLPPIPPPESAMISGMSAPAPIAAPLAAVQLAGDTSASNVVGQLTPQPARWSYDFDPATGQSRATYYPGLPIIPTALPGTSTQQAASTAFVMAAIATGGTYIEAPQDGSFYGRMNASWQKVAPLNSPNITGNASVAGTLTAATINSTGNASVAGTLTAATLNSNGNASVAGNVTVTGTLGATGGMATTAFTVNGANAPIVLDKPAAGQACQILSRTAGVTRWVLALGDQTAESGGNAGSNFVLSRTNDAGTFVDSPLAINRATGAAVFSGNVSTSAGITAGASILATGAVYGGTGVFADGSGQFGLFIAGNKRSLLYSGGNGYQDSLDTTTGFRNWITFDGTTSQMILDFPGNLTISGGTATKPGGGSWAAPSDARIKEVTGSYTTGLDAVCALAPKLFRYLGNERPVLESDPNQPGRADGSSDDAASRATSTSPMSQAAAAGTIFAGLVAQEAEQAMPELVKSAPGFIDGELVQDLRSLDTGPLIMALVNAVRELRDRLATVEAG